MGAYTELKEKFDHLQKRALQLFEAGQKREGRLETAIANVWNQLGEVSELDDTAEIKERLLACRMYLGDTLAERNQG